MASTLFSSDKLIIWIEAARPKTLAAAFVPVWLGASIAYHHGLLAWTASITAMLCAFLIQIGTNFANDYFDYKNGADTEERIGFTRATAAGLVSPKAMLTATAITMGLAFILGLYLVWIGGWVVLLIGILSLLFGIAYTGGPYPLGYNGLGDVFVFIFFGIIAVTTTYYVNALQWSEDSLWASLTAGALSTNILAVNNLRDTEQDRKTGKRTLGVIFGDNALRMEYTLMFLLAYAIPPHFFVQMEYGISVLLPLLTLPVAGHLVYDIWTEDDKQTLNDLLARTAQCMLLFGLFFGSGIILSP